MKTINSFRSKLFALTLALMASVSTFAYKSQWCDKWNVMWFDGWFFDETASTSQYRLGKDTIIGDYTYSKFIPGTFVRFTDDRKVYVYHEYFDDHDPYSEDLPTGEYLAYDFSAQVGDTLEVFSGVGTYSTYPCVVDDVQIDSETNLRTMTLHKICRIDEDEYDDREMTWIEGVGSPEGFLISYRPCGWAGGGTYALLCAYQGDELKYTGSLYERFGCDYKAGVVSDDLFPTLSGLQRTICREYYEQADNKTRIEQFTNLTTRTETGGPYLYYSPFLLREKDNKILIYSRTLNKDLVLYDFNLQVGDSLPMLYIDFLAKDDWIADRDMEIWCIVDYHKDLEGNILPADTLIVTDVSAITLLDGEEYKKWTFNNGMEYVEGIGSFGNRQWSGDFFQLIANRDVPTSLQGEHLVCASRNNKLLYQMDDAEMERLGAECLCQAENPEDLFPTLWGLQRTDVELSTIEGYVDPYHLSFKEYTPTLVNGKLYLCDGRNYFREENNQVLLYAPYLGMEEDLVLYDWTLEVGDTLPYKPKRYTDEQLGMLFRVTDVSTIQLLDGKEYKKWTFSGGYEFVEGIGAINKGFGHFNCLRHTIHTGMSAGERLVCASRNGQLLIDNTEKWGVECQCEIETSYKSQWCNQWNILSHGYQGPQDPLVAACTSIFWLSNNTVNRDGQEYIPLMCSSSKPDVESTNLIGELRFTEDKQVYFYYDNTEYLLYDFDVQVGDTLDIFGGIELYSYSFVEQKTYPHVITKIDTLDDGRLQITSDAIVIFEDGEVGTFEEKQQQIWIEGLGSINGIVHTSINPGIAGNPAIVMLCAYRDDECVYKTDSNDPYWIDYTQLGCVYNEGDFIEGAFPMLSGLQRTVYDEFCGEAEIGAVYTGKQTFDKIFFENNKPYILCNDYLLREEDNKILIYSQLLNKDLVLYDFTLEVGDSLPALYIYYHPRNAMDWIPYNLDVVDYNKDFEDGTIYPADTFVVTDVSNVTLLDGKEYKKWTFDNGMEYVEGIGMYGGRRNGNFFGLIREVVVPCHSGTHLVCVSKNGKLLYQMDDAEMERLGAECLCEAETPEDLFPTLWGLQRTGCTKTIGENENGTVWGSRSYLMQEIETATIDGKQYLLFGIDNNYDKLYLKLWLREENNKILVYSTAQKKDLVLYDFTLNVGDSLSRLYVDYELSSVVDYDNDEWVLAPLFVTEVSTITLLDGQEHKKWTFNNGMQYVEGIGSFGTCYAHNDFYQLITNAPLYSDVHSQHLVCVSKNNKLLYQMDDAEMERLGAECLCDYNSGPKRDNAKDGQIGGRPTPTQWNMLEMELRKMENGISILQAETFSYTLEDISQQVNSRTYFQLARQSTKDTATTKSVVGALHFGKEEDNRVYFLRDGVEYVLYDFTAEPGDTVEIFAGINNYPQETTYTHVVTGKDTLDNGACRMLLEVVFPDETTAENAEKVWLAGLGSVDGIVHNVAKRTNNAHAAPSRSASSSETESSVMLCAWREDSCLYTTNHPDYDSFGCVYNQDPTSVENPTSPSSYQKLLRDGQLLIIHNDKIYNVMGLDIGKSSIKIVESLTNN